MKTSSGQLDNNSVHFKATQAWNKHTWNRIGYFGKRNSAKNRQIFMKLCGNKVWGSVVEINQILLRQADPSTPSFSYPLRWDMLTLNDDICLICSLAWFAFCIRQCAQRISAINPITSSVVFLFICKRESN